MTFLDPKLRFNTGLTRRRTLALAGASLLVPAAARSELVIDLRGVSFQPLPIAIADFAGEDIARRYFSPFEVGVLCELPDEDRVAGFFRCWTRKEAYIKATGRGLSQALDGFDVTLGPTENVALLRTDDGSHERWQLVDVAVGPGYAGALAVEKPVAQIRYWNAHDRD